MLKFLAYSHGNSHCDTSSHRHGDSHRDASGYSHSYRYRNTNGYPDSDAFSDPSAGLLAVDQSVVGDRSAQWWNCYLQRDNHANGRFRCVIGNVSKWPTCGSDGIVCT